MVASTLAPLSTVKDVDHDPSAYLSGESGASDSPAAPPQQLDFLTNLLHAILSSENGLPCPLPADFCASLLRDDEGGAACDDGRVGEAVAEGVPSYPLFRYLARALLEWIVTGVFPRKMEPMPGIAEDGTLKTRIDKWTPLIVEIGGRLVKTAKRRWREDVLGDIIIR